MQTDRIVAAVSTLAIVALLASRRVAGDRRATLRATWAIVAGSQGVLAILVVFASPVEIAALAGHLLVSIGSGLEAARAPTANANRIPIALFVFGLACLVIAFRV